MSEKRSWWHIFEIGLNTLNHALIAICTFYTFWYSENWGYDKQHTWHVFWCAIGYQLLMAEGILAMYSGNSFTLFATYTEKKWLHALLQATGGIFGLIGFFLEIVQRWQANKSLFHIWHAIIGLVSAIFLGLSVFSGLFAFLPQSYKDYIRPTYVKCAHNLFGIAAFVSGMISCIIAYNTRTYSIRIDPGNMRYCIIGFLSATLVITLLGPMKTFYRHMGIFFRSSASSPSSEIIEKERSKTENGTDAP